MLDEVLHVDLADCAAQYVVAAYMTSPAAQRAEAALAALDAVRAEGHFWTPIAELERVAVEPLPGLAEFLHGWRSLVTARASGDSLTPCRMTASACCVVRSASRPAGSARKYFFARPPRSAVASPRRCAT